ncbi:unnamed protein product, partial [Polarella glacialis]
KLLCMRHPEEFKEDILWYWCALQSLTQEQLQGAKAGGWPGTTEETQRKLQLLHHEGIAAPSRAAEILSRDLAPASDPLIIDELMNIWFLNCFEYSKTASTIYFFSSFMSHSCYPNAVWYYRGADHIVRARRQIRPGEEVCISYLSEDDLLQHVPVRLQRLQNTKRFWCTCERCSAAEDPSRGFVCPQCDTGQMYAHVVGTEAAHPEGCRVLSSEFSA